MVELNLMLSSAEKKTNHISTMGYSYSRYDFLCFAFFIWFMLVLLNGVHYAIIDFDSAIDAVISKSISVGNGWRTSYGIFAENSSGHTIILPAAYFIWLLGNKIWVPSFSAIIINCFAIIIILLYTRKIVAPALWAAITISILFFFSYFKSYWWFVLTGDLLSYFFLVISCLVMVDPFITDERRRIIFLGLLVGLAFCTKMTVMAGFFGVFICILFVYRKKEPIKKIWHIAFFSLFVIFIFKFIEAYLYEYNNNSHYSYFDFLYWRVSNAPVLIKAQSANIFSIIKLDGFSAVISDFSAKIYRETFLRYGIVDKWSYLILVVPPIATLSILILSLRRALCISEKLIIILTLCFVFFTVQFFIIYRVPFEHHAFYMIWTNFMIIILVLSRVFKIYGAIIFIFLCLIFANPDELADYKNRMSFKYESIKELRDNKKYIESMKDVSNFIQKTTFRFPLANCGWFNATREIDYLLPDPVNFINCFDLIRESYVLDGGDSQFHWKNPVNFTLVINNRYWKYSKRHKHTLARQNLLITACRKQLLYESEYYRIMECPFENLKKTIPIDATNPFSEPLPEWADHN